MLRNENYFENAELKIVLLIPLRMGISIQSKDSPQKVMVEDRKARSRLAFLTGLVEINFVCQGSIKS